MTQFRTSLQNTRSNEQAWSQLLKFLSPQKTRNSDDELIARYQRLCLDCRPPQSSQEREELIMLRAIFMDAIFPILEGTKHELEGLGLSVVLPRLNRVIARDEYFRVRETSMGAEYILLAEVRDTDGRCLVWRDGTLGYPTRNSLMLRVRSMNPQRGEFEYDVLYSRAAFNEEMELIRLLVEPFERSILQRPLVPLCIRCIVDAAFDAIGRPVCLDEIEHIQPLERSLRDSHSFLVSAWGKRCVVRLSLRQELPFPLTRTTLLE